jgi:hypothetical protein
MDFALTACRRCLAPAPDLAALERDDSWVWYALGAVVFVVCPACEFRLILGAT